MCGVEIFFFFEWGHKIAKHLFYIENMSIEMTKLKIIWQISKEFIHFLWLRINTHLNVKIISNQCFYIFLILFSKSIVKSLI